jgi:predicted nucleic acid-binding protein
VDFVDTNILLYSISKDSREAEKAVVASNLLLYSSDLALSIQVLQEFYVQATRRAKPDRLSHADAVDMIESWLRFPVQEMNSDILRAALESANRFQLAYWDAAIIEAARALGCSRIYSEDLRETQNYGGIRVVNPFRGKRGRRRNPNT